MLERRTRILIVLALAFAGACVLGPPQLGGGNGGDDGGTPYADTLISTVIDGTVTACGSSVPVCSNGTPQGGSCGANSALGAPDGISFPLSPGDVLEVGFVCDGFITAQPDFDGGDFEIYGFVDGGTGVVEVSEDGNTFATGGILGEAPQVFSLSAANTDQAKFVRITGHAGNTIGIDSVEAF